MQSLMDMMEQLRSTRKELLSRCLGLMLLMAGFMLAGCSNESLVHDGYWRFDTPLQSRALNKAVFKTSDDEVLLLSYFAGPMLNPGVNTETSQKSLIGNMRCGRFIRTDDGLVLDISWRYELGGSGRGEVLNLVYPVKILDNGGLVIDGLMKQTDVPFVSTEEISNEEALAFQQYTEACKNQNQ